MTTNFRLPKSAVIKVWILWLAFTTVMGFFYFLGSLFGTGGINPISELFYTLFLGANLSNYLSWLAVILEGYLLYLLLWNFRAKYHIVILLVWLIYALAMYTFWIEPWLGWLLLDPADTFFKYLEAIFEVFGSFLRVLDLTATVVWTLLTLILLNRMKKEYSRAHGII